MTARDPQPICYDVWSTAFGPVGAATGPKGLVRFILPHGPREHVLGLLAGQYPAGVGDASALGNIRELTRAYFEGGEVDFREVPCDLPPADDFSGKVLRACREIAYGQTVGYSTLAQRVGNPRAARAVAGALGRNPVPLIVPCHRITYADGSLGGFSAEGGTDLKRRMLALEGGEGTGHRG